MFGSLSFSKNALGKFTPYFPPKHVITSQNVQLTHVKITFDVIEDMILILICLARFNVVQVVSKFSISNQSL